MGKKLKITMGILSVLIILLNITILTSPMHLKSDDPLNINNFIGILGEIEELTYVILMILNMTLSIILGILVLINIAKNKNQ